MSTATRKSSGTSRKASATKPGAKAASKRPAKKAMKPAQEPAPKGGGTSSAVGDAAAAKDGTQAKGKAGAAAAKGASRRPAGERAKQVKGRFAMPSDDYALLAVLKERAAASGARPRKNDLLRAGLHALMESGRVELRRALDRLPPDGKRRPPKGD